jgi:hypothetical protein
VVADPVDAFELSFAAAGLSFAGTEFKKYLSTISPGIITPRF